MYLHELIIEDVEALIEEGEPFSAWDVTQGVRANLDVDPTQSISDCPSFTDKFGETKYNVEHTRVKSLVHLYLKNYNPNKVQQAHGPKYIIYTPVKAQDTATPMQSILDPLGWLNNPRQMVGSDKLDVKQSPNITFHLTDPNGSIAPAMTKTTTYIDVGANKDKLTDAQLIEAAKKILKHFNGT